MFGFNDWFSFDGSHGYYPIMDTSIGSPTGATYQSQNVYMRDFTGGKVLLNPSDIQHTVGDLGGVFDDLAGQSVTSVTLAPHSGEILVKG